jgi:hypothetical protein
MAPMMVRRWHFHSLGMFLTDMSCPGSPGIGFDFEFSLRCWANGYQVGPRLWILRTSSNPC